MYLLTRIKKNPISLRQLPLSLPIPYKPPILNVVPYRQSILNLVTYKPRNIEIVQKHIIQKQIRNYTTINKRDIIKYIHKSKNPLISRIPLISKISKIPFTFSRNFTKITGRNSGEIVRNSGKIAQNPAKIVQNPVKIAQIAQKSPGKSPENSPCFTQNSRQKFPYFDLEDICITVGLITGTCIGGLFIYILYIKDYSILTCILSSIIVFPLFNLFFIVISPELVSGIILLSSLILTHSIIRGDETELNECTEYKEPIEPKESKECKESKEPTEMSMLSIVSFLFLSMMWIILSPVIILSVIILAPICNMLLQLLVIPYILIYTIIYGSKKLIKKSKNLK